MAANMPTNQKYLSTMDHLEGAKRTSESGSEYWFAREIQDVLGYDEWRNFEGVVDRARTSMTSNGVNASHHIVDTNKMVRVGSGARRVLRDFFLSRGACYLIAMNGDPTKPEIAAAQAYFAERTRAMEVGQQISNDEKRLQIREKVKTSFKTVSGVAKSAGVKNSSQSRFHDARYIGLYGIPAREVKSAKGIAEKENQFDRMGALELSAHDFQMNLAAETIEKDMVRGEASVIAKNKEVAAKVRQTMLDSGSRPPEELPAAEPIKEVVKRVKSASKKRINPPNA